MKCPREYRKNYKRIVIEGMQGVALIAACCGVFILLIAIVEGVI